MKSMLKKQLGNIPKEQQEKLFTAIEKDPEFFQVLAEEIQERVKSGMDQQTAAMEVLMANSQKLTELLR